MDVPDLGKFSFFPPLSLIPIRGDLWTNKGGGMGTNMWGLWTYMKKRIKYRKHLMFKRERVTSLQKRDEPTHMQKKHLLEHTHYITQFRKGLAAACGALQVHNNICAFLDVKLIRT